uniref:Uncharacterized protein n=1 Tax=Oryza nivara TaxID=4536 RepID=A0A0E0G5X6_ORYNI
MAAEVEWRVLCWCCRLPALAPSVSATPFSLTCGDWRRALLPCRDVNGIAIRCKQASAPGRARLVRADTRGAAGLGLDERWVQQMLSRITDGWMDPGGSCDGSNE